MKLRDEYAEIFNKFRSEWSPAGIESAVLACQELADRPPKELTRAELADLFVPKGHTHGISDDEYHRLCAVIAAVHAKQREPQVVKFRAARFKSDPAIVSVTHADAKLSEHWEWLEPAQEFEVRI